MKNKNKFYLFAAAVLFLSLFSVGIDGVKNVAKAECDTYEEQQTEYCQSSYEFYDEDIAAPTDTDYSSLDVDTYAGCMTAWENADYCAGKDGDPNFGNESNYGCPSNSTSDSSGTCVCDMGYTPDSDGICVVSSNFDKNGNVSTTCDPDPSCMFYNCCAAKDNSIVQSSEELAANKKTLNEAKSKATAATSVQNAATQRVNAEMKQQDMICKTESKEACDVATQSLNEAKAAYDKATEEAKSAIENANALSVPAGASTTTGAGYLLCANGVLATICEGGGGTPYVAGISSGGLGGYSGGGLGGNYGNRGTANLPKCGANFEDIGGVCFPMNTGLSNAPISAIVQNILSWLMGLFTVLAIMAFVISGVQYLMAAGDESLAETAKDNAKNAMIGIIVGLSGFIIIKAIAAALSGQSIIF